MRWLLVVLCVVGVVAASLVLREHYREDASPCSINERWDCGIVNHSPFAVFQGIPVAVIGIVGYLLLGALAFKRAYRLMLAAALLYVLVLPEWISWLILVVGVIGGALLLLRPAKAIMVALQYKNRSGEFGGEP